MPWGSSSFVSGIVGGPRLYLAIAVLVLAVGALIWAFRGDRTIPGDPELVPIIEMGNKKDVSGLNQAASSSNEKVAAEALVQLARVQGPAAAPAVQKALGDPRAGVRAAAASQFAVVCTRDQADLLKLALKDQDPGVRREACRAIGQLQAVDAADPMLTLIEKDPDVSVRAAALQAVEKIVGLKTKLSPDDTPGQRKKAVDQFRKMMPGVKALYRTPGKP